MAGSSGRQGSEGHRFKWGAHIRRARTAVGLTQKQLGQRLGLVGKGQAVYRWERNLSVPQRRHRAALLAAIRALSPAAAEQLAAALSTTNAAGPSPVTQGPPQLSSVGSAEHSATPTALSTALELAVLRMADELNLPARPVRGAAQRFLQALSAAQLTLEIAQASIAQWSARAEIANPGDAGAGPLRHGSSA